MSALLVFIEDHDFDPEEVEDCQAYDGRQER
jgi:hypothetical protein